MILWIKKKNFFFHCKSNL